MAINDGFNPAKDLRLLTKWNENSFVKQIELNDLDTYTHTHSFQERERDLEVITCVGSTMYYFQAKRMNYSVSKCSSDLERYEHVRELIIQIKEYDGCAFSTNRCTYKCFLDVCFDRAISAHACVWEPTPSKLPEDSTRFDWISLMMECASLLR